jgi:hypothetical protein
MGNLADYYAQSASLSSNIEYAIDVIPPLTETGGGLEMALFDGLSTDTTEQLRKTWRSDLLQIVDDLPSEYKVIACCFAEVWGRARYCKNKFGLNGENFILADNNGKKFEAVRFSLRVERGRPSYIKVIVDEDGVCYKPVACS